MGGKNHQPCRRHIHPSTMLSLAHSVAGIALEQTNVKLEHALLAELEGKKADFGAVLDGVLAFKGSLADFAPRIEALRASMKDENYHDLPTITSPELDAAGIRMVKMGMISQPAFERALSIYRSGSFYTMLDEIETRVSMIDVLATSLYEKAKVCAAACEKGELVNEMEENRDGNLRPEFAQLYTAWHQFNEFFLASSLVSTEAYYMANNLGSLVVKTEVGKAAAIPA